jgi:hypothetical protein
MPKPYAFHTLLSENKENLAQLEESLRLAQTSSKSAQREKKGKPSQHLRFCSTQQYKSAGLVAGGSVENKSPGEIMRQEMDDLRREFMGEINGLKASRTKQVCVRN